jgi:hypothetical protein
MMQKLSMCSELLLLYRYFFVVESSDCVDCGC